MVGADIDELTSMKTEDEIRAYITKAIVPSPD